MKRQAWLMLAALAQAAPARAETPIIYSGPVTAQTLASLCAATEDDATGGIGRHYCEGYIRAAIDLDPRLRRLRADCRNQVNRIADAIARRHSRRPDGIRLDPASDLVVALARTLCTQSSS